MSAHFDQIKSSLDDFCAAWKTNDGASLGGFFVEDGTLINPFGQRADGRAAVAAMYSEFFAGMLGGTSTTVDLASVRPVGADHAFADGEQTINSPDGSTVLEVHTARPGSYVAVDAGIAGRMSVSITIAVAGRAK